MIKYPIEEHDGPQRKETEEIRVKLPSSIKENFCSYSPQELTTTHQPNILDKYKTKRTIIKTISEEKNGIRN